MNHVLVSKRTFNKESGDLSFLQNFISTKYLKQDVDDDLSVCVDKCSPCGLSITRDLKIYQCHVINDNDIIVINDNDNDNIVITWSMIMTKIMTLLPSMEKCPMDFYHDVAFTAQIW